jgi:hypothetical protein
LFYVEFIKSSKIIKETSKCADAIRLFIILDLKRGHKASNKESGANAAILKQKRLIWEGDWEVW